MDVLNITVGQPPTHDILNVLKHIRPEWDSGKLAVKDLKGGNVNLLYYCALSKDTEENDVVILKVYGAISEEHLDQDKEVVNMKVANHVGMASPLYCRFKNGLAYKYQKGDMLTSHTNDDDGIARKIAQTFATLHHVDFEKTVALLGHTPATDSRPSIFNLLDIVRSVMPGIKCSFHDDMSKEKLTEFLGKEDAQSQLDDLGKKLQEMDFKPCFCHSDANATNIIYNKDSGEIQLIDWELGGLDLAAHEIGYYFVGRVMVDDCAAGALKFYPDKEYQLKWIRWYLEYKAELCGKEPSSVSSADVNLLYKGSILCALIRVISGVFFFLYRYGMSPSDNNDFKKANHFQQLYWIIKQGDYV